MPSMSDAFVLVLLTLTAVIAISALAAVTSGSARRRADAREVLSVLLARTERPSRRRGPGA